MSSVIDAQALSKKYRLYHEKQGAYATIVESLTRKAKHFLKKMRSQVSNLGHYEDFWALHDVSFQCHEGDRLGIVGKNGAGKSTLLKILSRIIEPSKGSVKIKGRVASLLEVGTGFHPELTGRENIFLNGSILGMSRREIRTKFDEIVAFAEMEKFLDTPVKYYSSGMYARLGFSIAAHLDPDILIVDEVLAVGDLQFQEKCFQKMDAVSQQGRTVLFVSHNTAAMMTLCNKGIFLENGSIKVSGSMETCINAYLQSIRKHSFCWSGNAGNEGFRIFKIEIEHDQDFLYQNAVAVLKLNLEVVSPLKEEIVGFAIKNNRHQTIAHSYLNTDVGVRKMLQTPGVYNIALDIETSLFWEGEYSLEFIYCKPNRTKLINEEIILHFSIYPSTEQNYFIDKSHLDGIWLPSKWRIAPS